MKWGGNEGEMKRAAQEEAAVHKSAPSASLGPFTTASESSIHYGKADFVSAKLQETAADHIIWRGRSVPLVYNSSELKAYFIKIFYLSKHFWSQL